ncbi:MULTISPECIES: RHS repeat-associated core domain-containing protein [unclassified Xanthomonas]|uniref:RHS repeat domain-containing protein n=1 Tax=unclassified Xanthomonas TaxID=2643310 RepID=UPI002A813BB4|nr:MULTISPECIES: RHS repeat-associated core domain-containing protein [unclassified Xanthomonas]MDY4295252.1 RHS repeat-associated core domain-containing protein [Xanthomonas sp. LF02-5]MDY4356250.1 RHS repeat-associated core domain-containing protein [Xanthomonas sp. LF04-12]
MSNFQGIRAAMHLMAAAALSLLIAFGVSAQTVRYIHTDGLGSVVLVTDKDRNIIERREYEPYGNIANQPLVDGPGYTGHVMDAATGLAYMQQRYYDPIIGRFLSVDPVAATTKPGQNFNRYWYGENNPYKFFDPDGRYVCVGGHSECYNFDNAMENARKASQSSNLSEGQKDALAASAKFFGQKGDSKIEVSFGDLHGAAANINTDRDGRGSVTFDLKAIAGKDPDVSDIVNSLAMRALHEGDHGVRIVQYGYPDSRAVRLDRERDGYRAEAYYQRASGFLKNSNNLWGYWNPGDGIDNKAIEARANYSVFSACKGSNEGSCR